MVKITYDRGYQKIRYRNHFIRVHRLVAIAEYGFDAVAGKDVHHADGVKLNNSRENIDLTDHGDHGAFHGPQGAKLSESDYEAIAERYETTDDTQQEIADDYGIDQRHVSSIVNGMDWR